MRALAVLALALPLAAADLKVRTGGAVVEMPLESYVTAVLAGESSVFQSPEALKAMAVAARTYAIRLRGRHAAEGYDFCETTHCQRVETTRVAARLQAAAAATEGELLWFEGRPAFTPYTRDCGGRGEDGAAIWPDLEAPYLKGRDDPFCPRAGAGWQWAADPSRIEEALRAAGLRVPQHLSHMAIAERTRSGRPAGLVLIGNGKSERIDAGSFRFAIGRQLGWNTLRSSRFDIRNAGARIAFEGSGAGHGAGLCQLGAEQMGIAGKTYREILAFYYPGTVVGTSGRGLPWQRLTGERITLLTTRPQRDAAVLAQAEGLVREIAARTRWDIPANLEIRVYPDVASFRDATGEPGWVAAYTNGRRIHMQPVTAAAALRHELLHAAVESQASPELPMWFREGLVEYLAGRAAPAEASRLPAEAELRQTIDPVRARRAYAQAASAVSNLVNRYGEAAVLDWVKRGLPAEVAQASASQPATNRK